MSCCWGLIAFPRLPLRSKGILDVHRSEVGICDRIRPHVVEDAAPVATFDGITEAHFAFVSVAEPTYDCADSVCEEKSCIEIEIFLTKPSDFYECAQTL